MTTLTFPLLKATNGTQWYVSLQESQMFWPCGEREPLLRDAETIVAEIAAAEHRTRFLDFVDYGELEPVHRSRAWLECKGFSFYEVTS